jgi:stearoyl-CoA desaturase (Delta-9 desaturase)
LTQLSENLPSTPSEPERVIPVSIPVQIVNFIAVILPFVGLIVAIVLLWGRGFSLIDICLFVGMYVLSGLGITVGYHRLFTHRAFETHAVVKFILVLLGSMALEGPVLKWVAQHRKHHNHSDQVDDPHSPHLHGEGWLGMLSGMWHAHMGWIFQPDVPNIKRYIPDLVKQRWLRFASGMFPVWAIIGVLIPTVLGGLLTMSWTGALLGFLWGGLVRIFFVHHITWSINSVCHLWGTRPYKSDDQSRNNFIFGFLAFGEGWHNNHHAFPASARHGLRWWEIDTSYLFIRGMELIGLAWNVRTPQPHALAAKRNP